MKKIEKENLIAIIISIVIAIIIVLAVNLNSTAVKIAFTHPEPTQDEYDLLKEYALQVAKNEYSDEDDDVKVEKTIEEENLKIKIQTSRMYGIRANFPISAVKDLEIENGTVKYEAEIDYDNDTYTEYTLIKSKSEIIVRGIIFATIATICTYTLIYWGPREFKKANKKIAK